LDNLESQNQNEQLKIKVQFGLKADGRSMVNRFDLKILDSFYSSAEIRQHHESGRLACQFLLWYEIFGFFSPLIPSKREKNVLVLLC
jgi:hypothetical protein